MADYDRDGFLDAVPVRLLVLLRRGRGQGGHAHALPRRAQRAAGVLFSNDGHGRFVDVTAEVGLEADNDRLPLRRAPGATTTRTAGPTCWSPTTSAQEPVSQPRPARAAKVRFEDVRRKAGVEDHGAGMSAAFLDYDNDGHLDIYTGNMWSDAGQRITGQPVHAGRPAGGPRALSPSCPRQLALPQPRRRDVRGRDARARAEMGRWAWSSTPSTSTATDGRTSTSRTGCSRGIGPRRSRRLLLAAGRGAVAPHRVTGTPYDDAWRAINRAPRPTSRSPASHQRNVFLRNDGHGGFDEVSGTVGLDLDQDGRSFAVFDYDQDGDPDLAVMAARNRSPAPSLPQRPRRSGVGPRGAPPGHALRNRDAVGAGSPWRPTRRRT